MPVTRRTSAPIYIDGEKARAIIAESQWSQVQICDVLGKSHGWLGMVLRNGKISTDDYRRICALGVDLSGCKVSEEEHTTPTQLIKDIAEVKNSGEALQKMMDKFSEERARDAESLVDAIDRLTTILSNILEKL